MRRVRLAPLLVYVPPHQAIFVTGNRMSRPHEDTSATRTDGGASAPSARGSRWRAAGIALSAIAVLSAIAAGAWWVTARLAGDAPAAPERAEIAALSRRLDAVDAAIKPIATDFTSEPPTGAIDVAAYRARIAAARRIVDETNGIAATGADAARLRDLIVTGGSQVLAGMDMALDAAVSDDASATAPAALQVEQGLQTLQEARDLLGTLTGHASLTQAIDRTGAARKARS
jgi:hypothetical protein